MSASGALSLKDETEITSKMANNNSASSNSELSSREDLKDAKKFDEDKTHEIYVSEHNETSEKIDFIDGEVDDNGREPTEEEMQTLLHVSERIPFTCWLIAIVELAERFSYYGLSAPFQNYMQNGPHDTPKGVLELKSQGATALSYFFQFWCYLTPLLGGFLSDTYWGKYNTIFVGAFIYVAGIFILFITSIPSINHRNSSLGGYIVSLILIGIATGFIKSNLSVLIADQIPKTKPRIKVLKNGTKVIEDPNVTMQNVFMFFYLMINIGSLSVMATTHLESKYGFWAAYLLTFCFFWIAIIVLVYGKNKYVKKPLELFHL
ncbi:Peptide transporter PTR2 [Kluyveromyces marxianus]